MGQEGHDKTYMHHYINNIYEGGNVHGNVPPNILEAMLFILSSNSNNCCLLYFNANIGNSYRCDRIGNYYPGGSKTTQGIIIYVVITIETTGELKLLTWTKLRLKTCGLSHLTTVIRQDADKTDNADDGN